MTALEKITGNPLTESVLTVIGASSGMPVAALLPVLSNSLANTRHKQRIEAALIEVNEILTSHEDKIKNLTDGQYKLINETVLSFFNTTCTTKINYLKSVIKNTLVSNVVIAEDGVVLSRVIRDISADEIIFLLKNFSYKCIVLCERESVSDYGDYDNYFPQFLKLKPSSKEELTCSSLSSLGLLASNGLTAMGDINWRFTSLVAKLIVLLKD
jgi:hypothetical protein